MKKKLSDILSSGNGELSKLQDLWDKTEATQDFDAPLPPGKYVAEIHDGKSDAKGTKQTPSFDLKFRISEGPFKNKCLWYPIWLTVAALPAAKRDLAKFGVTDLAQLDIPVPAGIICELQVVQRAEDDGSVRNRVRSFSVLRVETPKPDPFAPHEPSTDVSVGPTDGEANAAGGAK